MGLVERFGVKRVVGTSTHAIEFSVLAAVTVPLTIYFARNAAKWQVRWAAVLACGLALVSMPAAVPWTGVVAIVAALLVYMWNFKVRQLALVVVAGSAMIVSYVAVFPTTAYALWRAISGAGEDPSIAFRIAELCPGVTDLPR
jgi:hypothetical protein